MANGDDNDLLMQVIQRSMSGVPTDISDPYTHTPGVTDKDLDRLTKKLKKQYELMGTPADQQVGTEAQPRILQMGNQAGMLYPQGGGLPSVQPSAQPPQPIIPPTTQMRGTAVPQPPDQPPQPQPPAPQPPADPTKAVVPPLIPQTTPPATPPPPEQPDMTESERLGHVPQSAAAEQAPYREADGSPQPRTDVPGPDSRAGLPRGPLMSTGAGPNVIQQNADRAGMLSGDGGNIFSKIMQGLGNNSNLLLALGAGLAGAPSVSAGLGRAAAYAGPASAQDIKMQQMQLGQQATYNAFRQAGVPENLSQAAMYDPDLRKQLMEQYVVSRKAELKDITLPDGTKMTVQFDPYTQKMTDLEGKPLNLGNVPGMIDRSLTGQAAIDAAAKTNPDRLRHAMAIIQGREDWPPERSMTNPEIKNTMDLVRQIEPGVDAKANALRKQTIMSYGPQGKVGQTRLFLSNMMGHAEQLDKLNEIVGNWDVGGEYGNRLRNQFYQMYGRDKGYLDAKSQADTLRQILAGEGNAAFSGSHSVTGTEEMLRKLGEEKGTTSQHAAIKQMIHAAGTRLSELQSQFDTSMNTQSEGFHMLSPKAQAIFKKWEGNASGMDYDAKPPDALPQSREDATAFAEPVIQGRKTPRAAPAAPPAAAPAALPRVASAAEARKLPHGAHFIDPNGVERVNP